MVGKIRVARAQLESRLLSRTVTIAETKEAHAPEVLEVREGKLPFLDHIVDLWSKKSKIELNTSSLLNSLSERIDQSLFNRFESYRLVIPSDDTGLLPWEGVQLLLSPENMERFCPLRMVDTSSPYEFPSLVKPMRPIFLVGHGGKPAAFSQVAAASLFRDLLNTADYSANASLNSEAEQVFLFSEESAHDISSAAQSLEPQVVVFFGHGKQESGPQILCSGPNDWRALSDVCDQIFPTKECVPPIWVFWACSLAEDSNQPEFKLDGPQVFSDFAERGALAILAMRSQVRVRYARIMLSSLFSRSRVRGGSRSGSEPGEVGSSSRIWTAR